MRPSKRLNASRDAFARLEPGSTRYNVDITEAGQGRYLARCRESGLEVVSANAEHDICHLLTEAGAPDAPVQFWRNSTPSLSHSSIHRMGRYRVALGEQFPQRVRRREGNATISSESVAGSSPAAFVDPGVPTLANAGPKPGREGVTGNAPRTTLHLFAKVRA